MKIFLLISAAFILNTYASFSQTSIVKNDNDKPLDSHSSSQYRNFEESVFLKPAGPCSIKKIHLYLTGPTAQADSLHILADPAEGYSPPTQFVWDYARLCAPVVFNYPGKAGWYEIDVSEKNLRADGFDRIVVQHIITSKGPWFVYDNDGLSIPYSSFLCDALTPNPNFYNLKGTLLYYASGDFMVRLEVQYDFPEGETSQGPPFPTLFDITKEAGIANSDGTSIKNPMASAADWNGDGYDDISVGSQFFQNNGDGTFDDVSSEMGIIAGSSAWADYNGDGLLDCFANNGGWNNGASYDRLYKGLSGGKFAEDEYNDIIMDAPTVSPLWLDYNSDGLPDLFIAYGRTESGGVEEYFPDQLFKNLGGGEFENVTDESRISAGEPSPYFDCWGASVCDYNNDRLPDIFVATYRLAPDRLYKNNGDGTFSEVSSQTGVIGVKTKSPNYFGHGMGSDWGDFNNDGFVDLAVGNLGHPDGRGENSNPSLIFKNMGGPDYKFTEVHQQMGLKFFEMNAGIVWADLDLDGYQDLFHCQYSYEANGAGVERLSRVYINQGPENNYKLKDETWLFGSKIHGAWSPIRLDYDNDGDIDLLVASHNENIKLFRNDLPRKGNWISFRLAGSTENKVCTDAFGSSVTVYCGGKKFFRSLPGSVNNARTAQSSNELHFGIGQTDKIDSVVVVFSDGKKIVDKNTAYNRKYTVKYSGGFLPQTVASPALIYPTNFQLVNLTNPKLEWYYTGGADSYRVQVQENEKDFSTPIIDINNIEGLKFKTESLVKNKLYKWRVRANSESSESPWSSVWHFTVGAEAGTKDNAPCEVETYLSCSPNPFGMKANIEFRLRNFGFTDLSLFSLKGEKLLNIISKDMTQGSYVYEIESGSIPPGMYYCRLINGNTVKVVKLIRY